MWGNFSQLFNVNNFVNKNDNKINRAISKENEVINKSETRSNSQVLKLL